MVFDCQRGSALTETIVLMAVLVPLFLGIPMIGQMIDLNQTTVQASRYVAWETTVHDRAPDNVEQRFFMDASALIDAPAEVPNALWGITQNNNSDSTDSSASAGGESSDSDIIAGLDLYWEDSEVRVDSASSGANNTSAYDADTRGAEASQGIAYNVGNMVDVIGFMHNSTGGSWGGVNNDSAMGEMKMDGLIRGNASATMQGNGWLGPLTFQQGTVIMNDEWSAANAVQARDRVRTLVPAGALDSIGKFLGTLGQVPGMRELKYFKHDDGRGVFGYVDMEPLPPSETQALRPLKAYEEEE